MSRTSRLAEAKSISTPLDPLTKIIRKRDILVQASVRNGVFLRLWFVLSQICENFVMPYVSDHANREEEKTETSSCRAWG